MAGGLAYSKRMETKLLAEPSPLAAVNATIGYAKPLKVEEARGAWLRVSAGANAGWVFSGNVSLTEIKEPAGGLAVNASATTVTAAARGLSEESAEYAKQHRLVDAREDLNWLLAHSAEVSADDVETFLKEQKLGEYK